MSEEQPNPSSSADTKPPNRKARRKLQFGEDSPVPIVKATTIPMGNISTDRGRKWDFFALAMAFANWWYSVVAPEANIWISSALLLAAVCFSLFAAWEWKAWRATGRAISTICAVVVFASMVYTQHAQTIKRAQIAASAQQERERRDAYQLLAATIDYDEHDNPLFATIAYSNGSTSPIWVDEIGGLVRRLVFAGGISIEKSHLTLDNHGTFLGPGGDGQTEPFFEKFVGTDVSAFVFHQPNGKLASLVCADLLIDIHYHLATQGVAQHKPFRFVTRPSLGGMKWIKENTGSEHDYCNDKRFQHPH